MQEAHHEVELDYEAACRLHERLPRQLLSIPTNEELRDELERRGLTRPRRRIGFRPHGKPDRARIPHRR